MSLLMQALKKAEQAKKGALQEPPHPADSPSNFPPVENPVQAATAQPELAMGALDFDEPVLEPLAARSDVPVQPQIETEAPMTLEAKAEPVPAPEPTPEPTPEPPAVSAPVAPSAPQPVPEPRQRLVPPVATTPQMAQTVLAARPKPPRSRTPLLVIAGVLIVAGCGVAIYYYWQSTLIAAPRTPVAVQSAKPILPTQQPVLSSVQSPVAQPTPPGQPSPVQPKSDPQKRAPRHTDMQPAVKSASINPATQVAVPGAGDAIQVQHDQGLSMVNANLSKAYQLFMSGDSKAARPLYESVLREERNNRDALLGLAAIALRQHQNEQAAALYSRLLDLDPADPDAIAGLTSLGTGDLDRSESQLKKVLVHNQQSGPALFELGNVYAQQSRWPEAQDAYFRAFASTPGNANYAFNLAISLDRLGQSKLALDYYQKALSLSGSAPGGFNPDTARLRAAQLQQTLNKAPTQH